MKRTMATRVAIVVAGVFTAIAAIAIYYLAIAERPADATAGEQLFSVPKGSSLLSICTSLADAKLVRSAEYAYFRARVARMSLKAGTYLISASWSTASILERLESGKQEYIRVTVPEGLSLSKTARHLAAAGVVDAPDFIAAASDQELLKRFGIPGTTAEGYLFPETYFFSYGMQGREVVSLMLETFFQKAAEIGNLPRDSAALYRLVTLASIVEREYRVADEAPLIAGVFANRIKIGMGLQSCATIEYIITEINGESHPSRLTTSDLAIKSDYNTYLWAGLPPGPISNPGLVALSASANPRHSSYLYFRLTDPATGRHSFTNSLDEHVEAGRTLYLKRAAGF